MYHSAPYENTIARGSGGSYLFILAYHNFKLIDLFVSFFMCTYSYQYKLGLVFLFIAPF